MLLVGMFALGTLVPEFYAMLPHEPRPPFKPIPPVNARSYPFIWGSLAYLLLPPGTPHAAPELQSGAPRVRDASRVVLPVARSEPALLAMGVCGLAALAFAGVLLRAASPRPGACALALPDPPPRPA